MLFRIAARVLCDSGRDPFIFVWSEWLSAAVVVSFSWESLMGMNRTERIGDENHKRRLIGEDIDT